MDCRSHLWFIAPIFYYFPGREIGGKTQHQDRAAALQMMPIEMEIGRRKGVTFAINSIHWGKSAENLPICRLFFITLYIDRRRLSNKFPSKTRRLDTLYKMHPSQEGRLRRWV